MNVIQVIVLFCGVLTTCNASLSTSWQSVRVIKTNTGCLSLPLLIIQRLGWECPINFYDIKKPKEKLALEIILKRFNQQNVYITLEIDSYHLDFEHSNFGAEYIALPPGELKSIAEKAKLSTQSALQATYMVKVLNTGIIRPLLFATSIWKLAWNLLDFAFKATCQNDINAHLFEDFLNEKTLLEQIDPKLYGEFLKSKSQGDEHFETYSLLKLTIYFANPEAIKFYFIQFHNITQVLKFQAVKGLWMRIFNDQRLLEKISLKDMLSSWKKIPSRVHEVLISRIPKSFCWSLCKQVLKEVDAPVGHHLFPILIKHLQSETNYVEYQLKILEMILNLPMDKLKVSLRILVVLTPEILDLNIKVCESGNENEDKISNLKGLQVAIMIFHLVAIIKNPQKVSTQIGKDILKTLETNQTSLIDYINIALDVACYSDKLTILSEVLPNLIVMCLHNAKAHSLTEQLEFFLKSDYPLVFSIWLFQNRNQIRENADIIRKKFKHFHSFRCLALAMKHVPLEWFAIWELHSDPQDKNLFYAIVQAAIRLRQNSQDQSVALVLPPLSLDTTDYTKYSQVIGYFKLNIQFWAYDIRLDNEAGFTPQNMWDLLAQTSKVQQKYLNHQLY